MVDIYTLHSVAAAANTKRDWYLEINTADQYYDLVIFPLAESAARHGFFSIMVCFKDAEYLLPDCELVKLEQRLKDEKFISKNFEINWNELFELSWRY